MLSFENNLGWRIHKYFGGYVIRRSRPPMRSRIVQFGPVLLNIFLIVLVSLGREMIMRYAIYTIVGLFLVLWLVRQAGIRLCVSYALPVLFMLLALLARRDLTINSFFIAIPLSFIISLWFLSPAVLYVNVRSGIVTGGSYFPQLPASRLKVEIDLSKNNGRYRVLLKDTETLWKDSTSESSKWECIAWESDNEVEASRIADEFGIWGIGISDFKQQEGLIRTDRKVRTLFIFGYIVAVVVLMLLVMCMLHTNNRQVEEVELKVLVRVIQVVIAFVFLSLLPFGGYLGRLGWRTVKYRQMPPPRTAIIMNTKALEGDKAVKHGRILMTIAFLILTLSMIGGLVLPHVLGKLFLGGRYGVSP